MKRPARPRDPNQLAKLILDIDDGRRRERLAEGVRLARDPGSPQGWAQGREGAGEEALSEEARCDCEEGGVGAAA